MKHVNLKQNTRRLIAYLVMLIMMAAASPAAFAGCNQCNPKNEQTPAPAKVNPCDLANTADPLPTDSYYRLKVKVGFATNRVDKTENGQTTFGVEPRSTPNDLALVYGWEEVLLPVPQHYSAACAKANGFELVDTRKTHDPEITYHVWGVDTPVSLFPEEFNNPQGVLARNSLIKFEKDQVESSPYREMIRNTHGAGCSADMAARICANMYLKTGRPVLNIDWATQDQEFRFGWPPNFPDLSKYHKDVTNTTIALMSFQGLLREQEKSFTSDQLIDEGQSLGNTVQFLRELFDSPDNLAVKKWPKGLIWSDADFDLRTACQFAIEFSIKAQGMEKPPLNIVLYNSAPPLLNGDRALAASAADHEYPRWGQFGLDRDVPNFVCIDMASISPRTDPLLGHGENYELDNTLVQHLIDKDFELPKRLCAGNECKGINDTVTIDNFVFKRKPGAGNHWLVEYKDEKANPKKAVKQPAADPGKAKPQPTQNSK